MRSVKTHAPEPRQRPAAEPFEIQGYARGPNRFGIRNHIILLPTTLCTNRLAEELAEAFRHVRFGEHDENRIIALTHGVGCCNVGFDEAQGLRTLSGIAHSPNVGAILSLSLGCGSYCSRCGAHGKSARDGRLVRAIQGARRQFEVSVQRPGGSRAAFAEAAQLLERLIEELSQAVRTPQSPHRLVVGVMNGSSDPTSGLFSNPAVGYVSDWLIAQGGRVLFSQTLETLGAESVLLERTDATKTERRLKRLLTATTMMRLATEQEGVESEPTQGNRRRGISTLEEKSIGTIFKIGHEKEHKLRGVLEHGRRIHGPKAGLYLVDGPGQDLICLTGLGVAGAHMVLFTTGGGTPTGSALAPTLKITANRLTFDWMAGDIDLYLPVEEVLKGQSSLREVALREVLPAIRDVASGALVTSAEARGQVDFHIRQLWPTD